MSAFTDVTYKQPYIKHFSWFSQNQFLFPGPQKTMSAEKYVYLKAKTSSELLNFKAQKLLSGTHYRSVLCMLPTSKAFYCPRTQDWKPPDTQVMPLLSQAPYQLIFHNKSISSPTIIDFYSTRQRVLDHSSPVY